MEMIAIQCSKNIWNEKCFELLEKKYKLGKQKYLCIYGRVSKYILY